MQFSRDYERYGLTRERVVGFLNSDPNEATYGLFFFPIEFNGCILKHTKSSSEIFFFSPGVCTHYTRKYISTRRTLCDCAFSCISFDRRRCVIFSRVFSSSLLFALLTRSNSKNNFSRRLCISHTNVLWILGTSVLFFFCEQHTRMMWKKKSSITVHIHACCLHTHKHTGYDLYLFMYAR